MKYKILPYKMTSKSAKLLASTLGALRIQDYTRSRYRYRPSHKVINWGLSQSHPRVSSEILLNTYEAVEQAACKLKTLERLHGNQVPTLEWTEQKSTAEEWLTPTETSPSKVYCRTLLSSHSGRGIVVAETPEELVEAPLYTKGLTDWEECRIHIDKDGTVIDWQRKLRRNGATSSTNIRNHSNDYVFCRNVSRPPEEAFEVSKDAICALGLDFGAVDLAICAERGPLVLEVNTAPGLEGSTLENYASYFRNGEDHERS